MKRIILLTLAFLAVSSAAQAACYADYKAKRDDPLRLHYGVAEIMKSQCAQIMAMPYSVTWSAPYSQDIHLLVGCGPSQSFVALCSAATKGHLELRSNPCSSRMSSLGLLRQKQEPASL
jgi:hypothetical protein